MDINSDKKDKAAIRNNRHFAKRYFYTGHYKTKTKIRLTRFNAEVLESINISPDCTSFNEYIDNACINWFQIQGLTDDYNISRMLEEMGTESLDTRDVLTPSHVVKIDEYDNYFLVVLNSCFISQGYRIHSDHVSMMVFEKVVITFNEGNAPLFENVDKALETNIMNIREQPSGMLFAFLFNSVLADLIESSMKVENMLERIEDQLLGRNYNQKNIGARIQDCRHAYLIIRKNSVPLKEQFGRLMKSKEGIIPEHLLPILKDLQDQLEFIIQTTKNSNDILTSLVDLFVSNNDFKTNAVMKRLTVVSTLFAPITFLVGVWGMNFKYMPEVDWEYGYLISWLILIATAAGTWHYMKKKNWF